MSLSTYAYIVSAIEFLAAISFLVAPAKTAQWSLKLKEDEVTLRVVGAFFFVVCFLALTRGLSVGLNVEGLVRLTAWIGAVKSLLMVWWPQRMIGQIDMIFSRPALVRPFGLLALLTGVLFLLGGNYLQGAMP